MKAQPMENMLTEVGRRIRALREVADVSPEEMARVTDVTLEDYLKLEAGESDFTFTFIYKCAQRLGTDPTDILKGSSPTLSAYCVNRRGGGLPIARRAGFSYNNLAPLFRDKAAEPFYVKAKYAPGSENEPIKMSRHDGQEFDLVMNGTLKVEIDGHTEILNEGDSIYYDSGMPHGMISVGGDCEFLAVVIGDIASAYELHEAKQAQKPVSALASAPENPVADAFITTEVNESGRLQKILFHDIDNYNFVYDTVDAIAAKSPDKLAMLHLDRDKNERRFTFGELCALSCQCANYFASLGIKRGDRVMLVLKRHYHFWIAMLALHRMGAIAIPATHMLVEHDFDYRIKAAGVTAVFCTSDGEVAEHAFRSAQKSDEPVTLIMANGARGTWHDFDREVAAFPSEYTCKGDHPGGDDIMLMYFTSGTTGYPKIAAHSYKYALGHYITARYWHNVRHDGLHLTIADTGWGKAVWGKLYGQWLAEAPILAYDFERFSADDILPLFAKYNITTFCAPATMYRFFIKEDLSKYDLSSLSYCTTAGEAVNPEVFSRWLEATGLPLMEGFGQTETTLTVANLVGDTTKPGSMGYPSPMYDVRILDPEGNECPAGETGEICICTKSASPCGLFSEYYRDEESTRAAWHDGFYHTGDTAWRDEDLRFWYVGRIDDLIKSSGYRIGPFEIESVIMELPYVLECAVTAAPDEIRGQVVKASVVLTRGTAATDELKREIQMYVKEHTAPYKYPRIVEFLDELPKTISGKIRRTELRERK